MGARRCCGPRCPMTTCCGRRRSFWTCTSAAGCVCLTTSLSGTVLLHVEGQDFQLLERDALRFAADQPFWLENQFNGTARLLLTYRYLK